MGFATARLVRVGTGEDRQDVDLLARYEDAEQRGEDLDAQIACFWRSFSAKQKASDALIAGDMTLVEAAAVFQDAMENIPERLEIKKRLYPARTALERRCLEVIAYMRVQLRDEPETFRRVLPRLEAQLGEVRATGSGHP
jgi:hypothetical protein